METKRRPGRSRSSEVGEVRTLERGLHLLEVLSEAETLSLSELARKTDLSPSTATGSWKPCAAGVLPTGTRPGACGRWA